jgi:hypothetical protein
MDYFGLIQKFKINRELAEEERANQLKQKQRLDVVPIYELAVTRLNSTFLESVDKFYGDKGFLTAVMLAVLGMVGCFYVWLLAASLAAPFLPADSMVRQLLDPNLLHTAPSFGVATFVTALCIPLLLLAAWGLVKDSFAYTHYPIRLNRKNRTVYVFRLDGSVLAAKWDELFFSLGRGAHLSHKQEWDIRGHVLADDRKTVVETFVFSVHSDDQGFLRRHWEFLRRYMEDGPKEAAALVKIFSAVADRRESAKLGFYRTWANLGFGTVLGFFLLPLVLPLWLGRLFAMRTSKVPIWPAEVEAACRIEPGDPYERDERNNPPDMFSFLGEKA